MCSPLFCRRNFRALPFVGFVALAAAMPVAATEIVFEGDFDNSHAIQWVQHHSVSHAGLTIELGPAEVTAKRTGGANMTVWLQVPPGLNGNPDYPNWSALKTYGPDASINVGDCVLASGTITEFNGATELAPAVVVVAPSFCSTALVTPYPVSSMADVATDLAWITAGNQPGPRAEELESVLLKVSSLTTNTTSDPSGEFTVAGQSDSVCPPGCTMTISNFLYTHITSANQNFSAITGVLDQIDASPTYWLLPRGAGDVVVQ